MFVDFGFNMIPINLVHLLYLWIFGWIYALATFIAFTIDESRDEVYPILNWKYGNGFYPLKLLQFPGLLISVQNIRFLWK